MKKPVYWLSKENVLNAIFTILLAVIAKLIVLDITLFFNL